MKDFIEMNFFKLGNKRIVTHFDERYCESVPQET